MELPFKKNTRSLLVSLTAIALLTGVASRSIAEYPDRPIGVMVAYNSGGATDFQARIATLASAKEDANGKALSVGQPIYITNKPGAGGRKGWDWFASKAPTDGYMMAAYNVPHFIAQSIVFDTSYNIKNLEPVGNWGADPAVLIVGKDSQFNSATDLLDYARANPGIVTVSGAGKWVGHHIAHLQLQKASGVTLKYVPGNGGVGAMKLVKSGQVVAGFNNLSDSTRAQSDIKILAIADLERHAFLPDVPTLKELGIQVDNSSVNYRGLMVPKGTPDSVIKHLAITIPKMFGDKNTLGKMQQTNSPVKIMSREEVLSMWKERQIELTDLLKSLR